MNTEENNQHTSFSPSDFFEPAHGIPGETFTDFTPLKGDSEWMRVTRARRFGQWWVLRSVDSAHHEQGDELLSQLFHRCVMLWHPSVARVMALQYVDELDDTALIEEWVDGMSLDAWLSDNPSSQLRESVARQVVDVVAYLLDKNCPHGDLCSDNVLVTRNGGNVKLISFATIPPANPNEDLPALANILQLLQLDKKYAPVVNWCNSDGEKNGEQLRELFHRCSSRTKLRLMLPALALLTAIIVIVGAWHLGQQHSTAQAQAVPDGYFVDTMAAGDDSIFSVHALCNFLYLHVDKPTPRYVDPSVAIDLGLSVKWASINVGEQRVAVNRLGSYYPWINDTTLQLRFERAKLIKNVFDSISGTLSGDTLRDVATIAWGKHWRMPTRAEFQELVDRCEWHPRLHGERIVGYVVTGPNGNCIYLPLAGYSKEGINLEEVGLSGNYWTATSCPLPPTDIADAKQAYYLRINADVISAEQVQRIETFMSVRPVMDY